MKKVESIAHATFNTQDIRNSLAGEVDKGILLDMANLARNAQKVGGVEVLDGTILELFTSDSGTYAGTLSAVVGGEKIPLLTTMGARTKEGRKELVSNLNILKKSSPSTEKLIFIPPTPPVIVDYLYDTLTFRPDVVSWTGDFTKCLGWYMLAPDYFVIGKD